MAEILENHVSVPRKGDVCARPGWNALVVQHFRHHLFPDEIVVPAGFALYRMRFPGRKLIGRLILATYIFPGILLLVPVYQMMASLRSEERRVGKDWRSGASAAA